MFWSGLGRGVGSHRTYACLLCITKLFLVVPCFRFLFCKEGEGEAMSLRYKKVWGEGRETLFTYSLKAMVLQLYITPTELSTEM